MLHRIIAISLLIPTITLAKQEPVSSVQWLSIQAKNKAERTKATEIGMSIESVVADTSYGYAEPIIIEELKKAGIKINASFPASEITAQDFPEQDKIYHNYSELNDALNDLVNANPQLVHKFSIGDSLEGRNMWALRINPYIKDAREKTAVPGIIFMGGHHAREHLSVEVPLLLAQFLVDSYGKDSTITDLINKRDIYIIPMVNPDGAEYDIASGRYQSWRKNRNTNSGNTCQGVDLNRNYGYLWGTGGSSNNKCAETYMGPTPFSEPETIAMKNFVESLPNVKILLSFHTYSELILYPWGHKTDSISNSRDLQAFETMARTMAQWNGYTPEQSSDLYITSGDTTDWAYGTLGIFAFTFELSPKNTWGGGGFYPGASAVAKTFQDNLRPALYLIDIANDPYRASFRPETTLFYGR